MNDDTLDSMLSQDLGIYNPLIIFVEDRIARTKKSRRKRLLNGIYLEIFAGFNQNSAVRSLYDSLENSQRCDQFLGFFMEELERVGLNHLSDSLNRKNPNIERVEIRVDIDDTLYRLVTWKRISQVRLLEEVAGEFTQSSQDEIAYLRELIDNGVVSYLEITLGGDIYGGRNIQTFKKLPSHSLYVREEKHNLPKRYAKNGCHSQMRILSVFGRDHNMGAMIRQYLDDAEVSLSRVQIDCLKYDTEFIKLVDDYHRSNCENSLLLNGALRLQS